MVCQDGETKCLSVGGGWYLLDQAPIILQTSYVMLKQKELWPKHRVDFAGCCTIICTMGQYINPKHNASPLINRKMKNSEQTVPAFHPERLSSVAAHRSPIMT